MTPLILTADEAVLAASDTLTEIRRPIEGLPANPVNVRHLGLGYLKCDAPPGSDTVSLRIQCPWGGDELLYVCEAWRALAYGPAFGAEFHYQADGYDPACHYEARVCHRRIVDPCPDLDLRYRPLEWGPWQPAETMPVWASRFAYRNRGVRAELTGGVWQWVLAVSNP